MGFLFHHPDACVAQTAKGSRSKLDTVPPGQAKFNSEFSPEKWWLEDDYFPIGFR